MSSKAAAKQFFSHNVGRLIETTQTRPDGREWSPGPRTLQHKGVGAFTLDGSTVRLTTAHHVTDVSDTSVTVEWREDDDLIHTTIYTVTA